MPSELGAGLRYARALNAYLRSPIDRAEALRRVARSVADREQRFLGILESAVLARPGSVYARLLAHAGVERGDLVALVEESGIEGALEDLYDAGVFLTNDEFNGRAPVRRGSLELDPTPQAFDNPLNNADFTGSSGGTGGEPKRVLMDFRGPAHRGAYAALFFDAYALWGRPIGFWLPLPPGTAGIETILVNAKLGQACERWFTQTDVVGAPGRTRRLGQLAVMLSVSRFAGLPAPIPTTTPPEEAARIADWIGSRRAGGAEVLFVSTPSAAVRICAAAAERGLAIDGTMFWLGGEPYTAAKAAVVVGQGCRAVNHYYMAEIGQIGMACAASIEPDDVHVLDDTLGLIERPVVTQTGATVDALFFTTLQPYTPKLMLNVESGDCGIVEERDCDCAIGRQGFRRHVHTIRAYEKLTSEGMHFLGNDLVDLVERVLPERFGGAATDYQLVEEEAGGATRVRLCVSPRVGTVDPEAAVEAALTFLARRGRSQAMMADVWRRSGTLQVAREEPFVSAQGKIPAVRTLAPERRSANLQA